MFGMDAFLSSPGLVKMAATSAGIEAARLDVNPADQSVWLALRIRGQIRQLPVPSGKTFTIDQVIGLLFPDPAAIAAKQPPPP